MDRTARRQFRPDTLPASRRAVVVTGETADGAGLRLAGDREIVLTLRDGLAAGTAREIADLLNDAVENVTLLAG